MFVPYDERAGVLLQDEHFLNRKPWDFEGTPVEKYPLLLHYHPLNIYRHQVIKQTDVVLATFLAGDQLHARREAPRLRVLRPADDRPTRRCRRACRASWRPRSATSQAAYDYFLISRRDRPREPRRQRRRRHPRRVVRRRLDGARQRLRRAARHRGPRPALRAAAARRLGAMSFRAHRARQPPRGRDDRRRDDVPAARRRSRCR